mmetsp:Transcript_84378/g.212819  ORF Transcript_84378/g.212819 Transcript_84378/m.212819 type:complete len:107 (-) Transcript_84378:420-740(-)
MAVRVPGSLELGHLASSAPQSLTVVVTVSSVTVVAVTVAVVAAVEAASVQAQHVQGAAVEVVLVVDWGAATVAALAAASVAAMAASYPSPSPVLLSAPLMWAQVRS